MAYFDDPAHRAQWEKELAALREERQRRISAGVTRATRANPAKRGEEPAPGNSANLPTFEELVRQAAERRMNKAPRKSAEPSVPQKQPAENHAENLQEKRPEKRPEIRRENPAARGTIRERITFSQLLAEEENRRQLTPPDSGAEKRREMEAGNAR